VLVKNREPSSSSHIGNLTYLFQPQRKPSKDNGQSSLALQPHDQHDIHQQRPGAPVTHYPHQLAETSFRELQFLAVNHSYLHEILTLRNLRRFSAMKELRLITADHLWDEREDGWNWKKVDGKIEIIEKVLQWNEDRESLMKSGLEWHKNRLLHEFDGQGLSTASILVT
jgi:hypothetical protein